MSFPREPQKSPEGCLDSAREPPESYPKSDYFFEPVFCRFLGLVPGTNDEQPNGNQNGVPRLVPEILFLGFVLGSWPTVAQILQHGPKMIPRWPKNIP